MASDLEDIVLCAALLRVAIELVAHPPCAAPVLAIIAAARGPRVIGGDGGKELGGDGAVGGGSGAGRTALEMVGTVTYSTAAPSRAERTSAGLLTRSSITSSMADTASRMPVDEALATRIVVIS